MKKYLVVMVCLVLYLSLCFATGEKVKTTEVSNIPETTTKSIQEYKVTFIELGSVKCVPCQMMVPVMDEVKKEYPNVNVVFHDVWTKVGAPYAEQYNVRGIPTQIFLDKNGNEYSRHEGFFPKEELVKVLEEGFKK